MAAIKESDQDLRFVHNPSKSTKRKPLQTRLEITSQWLETVISTRLKEIRKFAKGHLLDPN